MPDDAATDDLGPRGRYAKQVRFEPIGPRGQRRLAEATAVVVGCGALGSLAAATLVRAGVGRVRIVDRDFVELSNLQRQFLFDEADAAAGTPKAVAAAAALARVNSGVVIEPIVADFTHACAERLAEGAGVLVDGTDNFATRLLLNDLSVGRGAPWVYGGVLGAEGRVMPVVPGRTACLACLMPDPPAPGDAPTCDTAGVVAPAVGVVASLQALEAIKLLVGAIDTLAEGLSVVDLWGGRWRRLHVPRDPACRACGRHDLEWLDGRRGDDAVVLCGRGAVQVSPRAGGPPLDLAALAERLAPLGSVTRNPFLVRLATDSHEVTLFADGRAIVGGVESEAAARAVLARLVGG